MFWGGVFFTAGFPQERGRATKGVDLGQSSGHVFLGGWQGWERPWALPVLLLQIWGPTYLHDDIG